MKRYRKYIKKRVNDPLSKVQFHTKAPIKRLSMLNKKRFPFSRTHIAVHFINSLGKKIPNYSKLHKHTHDEINLILSEKGKLTYEIQLDDEVYKVSSPSTVFIPKRVNHKAKVISGKGIFICVILK